MSQPRYGKPPDHGLRVSLRPWLPPRPGAQGRQRPAQQVVAETDLFAVDLGGAVQPQAYLVYCRVGLGIVPLVEALSSAVFRFGRRQFRQQAIGGDAICVGRGFVAGLGEARADRFQRPGAEEHLDLGPRCQGDGVGGGQLDLHRRLIGVGQAQDRSGGPVDREKHHRFSIVAVRVGPLIGGRDVDSRFVHHGPVPQHDPAAVECCQYAFAGAALTRDQYGGINDADNSGSLQYVVVKHTGATVGNGDELNGITFGAVGSNTTVKNLQVYSVYDDGIEMFVFFCTFAFLGWAGYHAIAGIIERIIG